MEDKEAPTPKYKGASAPVYAIGQSAVDGATGLVGGGIAGAAIGALSHDVEKSKAVRESVKDSITGLIDTVRYGSRRVSLPEEIKEAGFVKNLWHASGRGTKALLVGIGASVTVGVVAAISGLFRGAHKAQKALDQFYESQNDKKVLETKIEGTESQLKQSQSFVDRLQTERSDSHGHTR